MLPGMSAARLASCFLLLFATTCPSQQAPPAWPQGAGPNGNWQVTGPAPPLQFSATTGDNILWRTPLPETGQGGIAIANGRLFVTTMAPWNDEGLSEADAKKYSHAIEKRTVVGKHIDGHCIDQATGKILWTRRIEGEVPSIYSYPFSDATSASPVASNTHVWFTNSGGTVSCYTHEGKLIWQRTWTPTFDGPFNKQFEPFLVGDVARGKGAQTFVHMVPFDVEGETTKHGAPVRWHHLVGLDALTGKQLWRSEDALTQYNAPILMATKDGPCVLHARGGPHAVPERPVGLSLTRVSGEQAGSKVWRYEDPRGNHEGSLQTMACDERYVYWLLREPRSVLVLIDRHTGKELREISLTEGVRVTHFPGDGTFSTAMIRDLEKGVFPARYSMIPADGRLYFQTYATAWGKPVLGAPYSFASVDPDAKDGKAQVHYHEAPSGLKHEDGGKKLIYRRKQLARAINSGGTEVTGDKRSRWDGWDWVFNGSPTRINNHIYFTLASGIVYVIKVSDDIDKDLGLAAINDIGPRRKTWSANSVSYADGRLYHRTAAELLCIGTR